MFAKTQMGGLDFAMPDVCLTPIPSPVGPIPTPLPYPNIGLPLMAIPTIFNILTMAMPNHNLLTRVPITTGDEAGLMMGVVSGMIKGPSINLIGSMKVLMGGAPATTMLKPTGQNGMLPNTLGMSLAPSQVKSMIMS